MPIPIHSNPEDAVCAGATTFRHLQPLLLSNQSYFVIGETLVTGFAPFDLHFYASFNETLVLLSDKI